MGAEYTDLVIPSQQRRKEKKTSRGEKGAIRLKIVERLKGGKGLQRYQSGSCSGFIGHDLSINRSEGRAASQNSRSILRKEKKKKKPNGGDEKSRKICYDIEGSRASSNLECASRRGHRKLENISAGKKPVL